MPDRGDNSPARNRYPGYDVLAKRIGPSWNEQTRRVITRRLAIGGEPRFFTAGRISDRHRDRVSHRAAAGDASADPGGIAGGRKTGAR